MPSAVVDLGTNTFHLLVAQWRGGELVEVYRERHFVKLAEDGIERIGQSSVARAVAAAIQIGHSLRKYELHSTQAFATAALRTATNGPALREVLEEALGVPIEIIDGRREAELIARGVMAAQPPASDYLIMDIGGGSVEFVRVKGGEVGFSESYPLGAQVLRRRFHGREPFGKTEQDALDAFLEAALRRVVEVVGEGPLTLVGASGTFDVLADIYGTRIAPALCEVPAERVRDLYREAAAMTAAARAADPRIPAERADMIVVALGLIDFWVRRYPAMRLLTCDYALKEGALPRP